MDFYSGQVTGTPSQGWEHRCHRARCHQCHRRTDHRALQGTPGTKWNSGVQYILLQHINRDSLYGTCTTGYNGWKQQREPHEYEAKRCSHPWFNNSRSCVNILKVPKKWHLTDYFKSCVSNEEFNTQQQSASLLKIIVKILIYTEVFHYVGLNFLKKWDWSKLSDKDFH